MSLPINTHESSASHFMGWLMLAWLAATISCQSTSVHAEDDFLSKHCFECHSGDKPEAGLNLEKLDSALQEPGNFEKWERIYDRIATGEMPPQADPMIAVSPFVTHLKSQLIDAHAARKGTVLRRLNRQEYQNTINDLLGINLKLVERLPPDTKSQEFSNIGESLSISMVQMQQYIDCATAALEEVDRQASRELEQQVVSASYATTQNAEQWLGKVWLKRDDGAVVFFKNYGYPTGMLREATVQKDGFYKIRVKGYAYQSERPITFSIGATTFARGLEQPTFGFFEMPPGEPTTIETVAWLPSRYMVELTVYGLFDGYALKTTPVADYRGPGLAIQGIEIEGPIPQEVGIVARNWLYQDLDRKEIPPRNVRDRNRSDYLPKFNLTISEERDEVSRAIQRFAERAFRRPVELKEIESYFELFCRELDKGSTPDEALRTAWVAVLCSPDFLFLREKAEKLNDHELANRLSYFLQRSAPDVELRELAVQGELSKGDVIKAQANRLIDHSLFDRFVRDMSDSWLQLEDINFTNPDGALYPEYDPYLQWSMLEETRQYLRQLIRENRRIEELVKSDYAWLNERLAEHYGIDDVRGPQLRQVRLEAQSLRGGLLSQGAVLKVSANGTNTSPVVRGAWVMERILGQKVPPPPPGVPGVEPDIRGASTLRELLDKHRNLDSCNSCHRIIDPPGFALESFDPIGGFRERFRTTGEGERVVKEIMGRKVQYRLGAVVDDSGEFSDKQKFTNYIEFREILSRRRKDLSRALVIKLLTFSTGREMGFSDRAEIEQISEEIANGDHGIRDVVMKVVGSEIFQSK